MLSSLIWIPALGAAVIGLWPGTLSAKATRQLALGFAAVVFGITVAIATQFDAASSAMQFEESLDWLPPLGLHYRLGIDGLSLPLLILNSFLVGIAIYSSKEAISRHRLYYSLILLLGAAVAGAFTAQNLLLFFLFYEVELLPPVPANCHLGRQAQSLCSNEVPDLYSVIWNSVAGWFFGDCLVGACPEL